MMPNRLIRRRQRGLTLVELLVSIVLMLLVSIATVALFSVSSSTYKTVDAGQELQDNARFAMHIISEAARSAGFQDRTGPVQLGNPNLTDVVFGPTIVATWRVQGANNGVINTLTDLKKVAPEDASTAFSTSGVYQKSDALVLRFFGASDTVTPANPDNTMRDCSGRPHPVSDRQLGCWHQRLPRQDSQW
jgi:type IV pilus assembly protein PilW